MAKATGIGGVFFKSDNPKTLMDWYTEHLGIPMGEGYVGADFDWREKDDPDVIGRTVFSPFERDTTYFDPGGREFMVNFRVDDLDGLLAQLKQAGVWVDEKIETCEGIGRFGWIRDCEGNRIELWQPESAATDKQPA